MNREIKFRVWDILNKRWVTHSITISAEFKIYQMFIDELGKFHCFSKNKKDYVFQQFTGLKDKNGKEIYEGDICNRDNWSNNPFFVRYSRDGYFWQQASESDETFYKVRDCFYDSDNLRNGIEGSEIIGNIFENPELISEK